MLFISFRLRITQKIDVKIYFWVNFMTILSRTSLIQVIHLIYARISNFMLSCFFTSVKCPFNLKLFHFGLI
jgi:hypothetical protein